MDLCYRLNKIFSLKKDNIAIVDDFGDLKYSDIDKIAREISEILMSVGVRSGDIIAIDIEQSRFLIPALIGVLRAKAVILPLHPIFPPERNEYIVSQSNSKGYLKFIDNKYLFVPLQNDASSSMVIQSNKLAYILYTSGSTGKPKGVAMTMKSLSRLIDWHLNFEKDQIRVKTTQFAPITFDVSFQEIFSTLCLGGTLFIVPEKIKRDPVEIINYLSKHSIERLFIPTAILDVLAEAALQNNQNLELRHVFVAGEQLKITSTIRSWFEKLSTCRLHNHYGPTETHVVTTHTLPDNVSEWEDLPPIGKPLPHVKIHILDNNLHKVPLGNEGELYIEGDSLADGYLNQPEITSERFIYLPRNKQIKLYKTGDIVIEKSGVLFFKGRSDGQVKVNGFRIETGEVEIVLSRHPDVKSAFVCIEENNKKDPRLIAFLVLKSSSAKMNKELILERVHSIEWENYLRKILPSYMIPSIWVMANRLPLNQNGKVDKSVLLPILRKRPDMKTIFVAPLSKVEKEISQIWQEILLLNSVGIDDNFFDLGGNSLMAVRVIQQINSKMNLKLPIVFIYANPSIKQLAKAIESKKTVTKPFNKIALTTSEEPLAIVGVSCRFPGAKTPNEFWKNLIGGIESIKHFDEVRESIEGRYVSSAGILENVEFFDSSFFGFSPSQAELLDPQHRIFFECVWEAMEDASVVSNIPHIKIGLFGGCGPSSYLINNIHSSRWKANRTLLDSTSEVEILLANDKDFLTSRAAYLMNFQGPVSNVNAACATSLYAVHYAIQSLRENSCDVALAGAVCVPTPQLSGYFYEPSMPFSKDGHCRPFDKNASGTVFGSGCGVIVLKRLKDALADGNQIYALLRGSSINNDGSDKVGITAPSVNGQSRVICDALANAGVDPKNIAYIETHGTATEVGDLIEFTALKNCLQTLESCGIGSVKSNIGHIGWAAGMAGLIKATLSLHYRKIPPTINFHKPNSALQIESSPFYVVDKVLDLKDRIEPYIFGVSAFGLGGTNAHVILEEAPKKKVLTLKQKQHYIIPLSARNLPALKDLACSYASYLQSNADISLDSVLKTSSLGRVHHNERKAIIASEKADFVAKLNEFSLSEEKVLSNTQGEIRGLVGLFGGHGTEYIGSGYDLYKEDPFFRTTLQKFNPLLKDLVGQTIEHVLYPDKVKGSSFTDVVSVHIANFVIQYGMFKYWEHLGYNFNCFLGHSLGEYAAACAAGVFSEEDALTVVVARGKAINKLPPNGRMAVVLTDEQSVSDIICREDLLVDIAVVITLRNTVISGHEKEIIKAFEYFSKAGLKIKLLESLRAGHCYLMEPILDEIAEAFDKVSFNHPKIPLVSNLTGELATNEVCNSHYWKRHLRETVRFYDGVLSTQKDQPQGFVEFSGAPALLSLGQTILPDHPGPWIPSLRKNAPDTLTLAKGVGELYEKGFMPNWKKFCSEETSFVNLPTYPFQRKKLWIEQNPRQENSYIAPKVSTGRNWRDWVYKVVWEDMEYASLQKQPQHKWLIISNKNYFCENLIKELNKTSISYILVNIGEDYQFNSSCNPTINPFNEKHVLKLITDIREPIDNIVLTTAIDLDISTEEMEQDLSESLKPVFSVALSLVKGIPKKDHQHPPRLWFLTRGAKAVFSTEKTSFIQTPLWGMRKVLEVEKPLFKTTCLDLEPDKDDYYFNLIKIILLSPPETEIALRNGRIYIPYLKPYTENTQKIVLEANSTYLITGGLGGLGLWTAKNLVSGGAKHLILVGRSDPSLKALNAISDLESLGAKIDVYSLDVSCGKAVIKFFANLKKDEISLKGIIHCAGAIEDKLIDKLKWENFVSVFMPKAQGAWNIHKACEKYLFSLDFFVLFSSATSLLGNYGQANYAAANAFIDGLAEFRSSQKLPAVSIHWGVWSGVGGVADRPGLLQTLESKGMGYIDPANGAESLMHYMHSVNPEIGILPHQWNTFLNFYGLEHSQFFKYVNRSSSNLDNIKQDTNLITQLFSTVPEKRVLVLEKHLLAMIQKFITNNIIASRTSQFSQMGLDSLSLIQLRNALQRTLQCQLPPELIALYPTVEVLSKFLADEVINFEECEQSLAQEMKKKNQVSEYTDLKENIPLSIQQKRWLRLIRNVNYGQRVVPVIFYTRLEKEVLYTSLLKLLERHELLCYTYSDSGAKLLTPKDCLPHPEVFFIDFSHLSNEDKIDQMEDCVSTMQKEFPDPYFRPSWMLKCIKLENEKFSLLVGAQHLEFDGSGLSVFIYELREIYKAELEKTVCTLPIPVQYHEYVAQQKHYLKTQIFPDRTYFEGLFTPLEKTTQLPNYHYQTQTVAYPSRRYTSEKFLGDWNEIQSIANICGITGFSLLLTSFAKLISSIIDSKNIIISIIRSGRTDEVFSQTIGPFTMPFPIPVYLSGHSIKKLVQQCNKTVSQISSRADFPSTDLIESVSAFTDLPFETYFSDASINFTNYKRDEETGEPKVEIIEILGKVSHPEFKKCNFEDLKRIPGFHLVASVKNGKIQGNYWYHIDRFSENQVAAWAEKHRIILENMIQELREIESSNDTEENEIA